jgi:hypothetical protein
MSGFIKGEDRHQATLLRAKIAIKQPCFQNAWTITSPKTVPFA